MGPRALQADASVAALRAHLTHKPIDIVHLIYRDKAYELDSKDYEFSRSIVDAHWAAGLRDAEAALSDPEWLSRGAPKPGSIRTFDHANTKPAAKERKP